jgi:hypothetical protein
MKKTGVILVAIAVLLAILYFLIQGGKEDKAAVVTAAELLPEEVIVAIEQKDLGQLLDDFKVSRLGRTLVTLEYVKIASELGLPEEDVNKVRETREQIDMVLTSPLFQEFLGKEFTVALLPTSDVAMDSPEKTGKSSFLFIARPRHDADILALTSDLFAKKLEQTTITHGKHSLKQYQLDEKSTLTIVTLHGLVIAAFDEKLVQGCLDRYDSKDNRKKTLATNSRYIRLRQDFIDAKLMVYASVPALQDQIGKLTDTLDPLQKEEVQKAFGQWQGLEELGFGVWQENGLIRDKGVVLFNKDKLDPLVKKAFMVQPVENKTLAMAPADILAYYWSNSLDLRMFWEMLTQEMKENAEQLQIMKKDVKNATGYKLSEIFQMVGSEFVILLKDIATDGFIPLPKAAIILKIEQEQEFAKMAQTLLTNVELPSHTDKYKGVALHALGVSLHPALQPVYALHQGYLVLSSTLDMAKQVVDSQEGGGLLSENRFQQVNQGLDQKMNQNNNSVSYFNFSLLLEKLKELANWGGTMLSLQDPDSAQKAKVALEQLILPLLDGLAMFDVIGSRSFIQDDAMILESVTVLAAKPAENPK